MMIIIICHFKFLKHVKITVSPKTGVLYLKNVTITRMVWSVDRHVVTVATGSSVITRKEVVHLDVTLVLMV